MFKHILVPTDGSELSQAAARQAVAFARETGARITAFHAKPIYLEYYYVEGIKLELESDRQEKVEAHCANCLGFIEKLCQEAGVPCTTLSVSSNAVYEAIIKAATGSGCDLIFMASHGHSGLGALILGSETTKVLTHSKIPVLVYRQPG